MNGKGIFQDDLHGEAKVGHKDFSIGTTDFSGTNWEATAAGDFNINNLVVRGSARFRELIIDQLSIIAGSQLLSVARGKIESKSGNTVTLEDPNDRGASRFVMGDFFWIKTVDIDGALFSDVRGQVAEVDGITLTLDLTVTGANGAMADISPGDVIVQRGHGAYLTQPAIVSRQNMIYTTVSDADSPVEKYLTGINTLAAFDVATNVKLQTGNMSSAPSVGGVTPSGFGLYSDNVYLKGIIVAEEGGLLAGWDITEHDIRSTYDGMTTILSSQYARIDITDGTDVRVRITGNKLGDWGTNAVGSVVGENGFLSYADSQNRFSYSQDAAGGIGKGLVVVGPSLLRSPEGTGYVSGSAEIDISDERILIAEDGNDKRIRIITRTATAATKYALYVDNNGDLFKILT